MKRFIKKIGLITLAVLLVFSFIGCDGQQENEQEPEQENEEDNIPKGFTATFGQELSEIILPQGWEWLNPTDLVGNAGLRPHYALNTTTEVIHQMIIQVGRADPIDYIIPNDLTARTGVILSDIDLPPGWKWNNPQDSVGEVGLRSHYGTYTPSDVVNYNTFICPLPVMVIDDGGFTAALRAELVPFTMPGEVPKVVDMFADGARLHFLVEAGQIKNIHIGNMVEFSYSGFGGMSMGVTDITTQTFERITTETVSESFTFTNESGGSRSIATMIGAQLGTQNNNFQFSVTHTRSWNWSASHSQTGEKSFTTSLSEANSVAREFSNTLSVTSGDPAGNYRIALYSTGQVYFFITTCLEQETVYEWDTVVVATGFLPRQEFSPNNNFDNSPIGTIDFPDDFIDKLEPPDPGVIVDYSNFAANQLSGDTYTIQSSVQRISFIGRFHNGVTFSNFNIIIAPRSSTLIISFENFGMQSNTVGITSSSQAVIIISLKGNNRIIGGNGAAVSGTESDGVGRKGLDGHPSIFTNGNLILTGGGSVELIGGNGSTGSTGFSYGQDARAALEKGRDGGTGGNGGMGGNGIDVHGLNNTGGVTNVIIRGGNGGNGGAGGTGEGTNGPGNSQAGHGGTGGKSGDGGTGVLLRNSILSLDLLALRTLQISGGNSGNAGRGGNGGIGFRGGNATNGACPDHGGNGGDGGSGGRGGIGINFVTQISSVIFNLPAASITSIVGGRGGNGGSGGTGGEAMRHDLFTNGRKGAGGLGGNGGNGGLAVRATNITDVVALFNVSGTSQGGTKGIHGENGDGNGSDPNQLERPNNRTPQPSDGATGQRVGSN